MKNVRIATPTGIAPDLVRAVRDIGSMPTISAGDIVGPTEIGRISAAEIAGSINAGAVGALIKAQPHPSGTTVKQIVAGINQGRSGLRINPGSLPTVITAEQVASVAAAAGPLAAIDVAHNVEVGRT
jgi:hypothetical protein